MAHPWPPDYTAEYQKRVNLMRDLMVRPNDWPAIKAHYAANSIDWINDWCITYNPRNTPPLPKTLPFVLFDRQRDFIQFLLYCISHSQSGLVEKSRDMGATWLCCAFSVWLWLFTSGASIGWGSRKEQLIDRLGDPDSIFQKMRMIIDKLPAFMLPDDFNIKQHATYMKIINPETGATITGEAGDNIGRGGRSLIYFKDESAHYERPELVEASLGDNTDVQIDISSVNGANNVFYKRRQSGEIWYPDKELTKGSVAVFIMDWREHPLKTDEWYKARRDKAEREGLLHLFAQEVDRDYLSSLDRQIIPALWVKTAIDAHIKLGFGEDGERIAMQDVADEGGDKNALAIRHGVVLKYAEHWGEGDTGATARRGIITCKEFGIHEYYYDSIGVGAGVKAETNRMIEEGLIPRTLRVMPWNAAASPINPTNHIIPHDDQSPCNEDFFGNLKAQAWWGLRTRFEKTYKAITQGAKYDHHEMISLPSDLPRLQEIIAELSQATIKPNVMSGKLIVDKKPEGARSPNLADAIVGGYFPTRELSILDVI